MGIVTKDVTESISCRKRRYSFTQEPTMGTMPRHFDCGNEIDWQCDELFRQKDPLRTLS